MTEVNKVKPRARRVSSKQQVEAQVEEVATTVEEITTFDTEEKTFGIIAVDNGGDNVKVMSEDMEEPISFKSDKKLGIPLNLNERPSYTNMETHSFVIQWNGKIYLTNQRMSLAVRDGMTGNVKSKAKDYFILSTLIAVALYGYDKNLLVTSVPYNHLKEDSEKVKALLLGDHTIVIDGETHEFEITDIVVAIEAQAGHVYIQEEGTTTMLEIGSRTVGYSTNNLILNEDGEIIVDNPIFERTGTLARKGVEISNIKDEADYELYVHDIFKSLSNEMIDEDDRIVAFGGGILIESIKNTLDELYSNILFADNPLFIQVLGMLEIGKMAYEEKYGEGDDE